MNAVFPMLFLAFKLMFFLPERIRYTFTQTIRFRQRRLSSNATSLKVVDKWLIDQHQEQLSKMQNKGTTDSQSQTRVIWRFLSIFHIDHLPQFRYVCSIVVDARGEIEPQRGVLVTHGFGVHVCESSADPLIQRKALFDAVQNSPQSILGHYYLVIRNNFCRPQSPV